MRLDQTGLTRATLRSWITIRVRRAVTAFQTNLMGSITVKLNEEVLIDRESAVRISVEFDHPTAYAFRIKLLVPGMIERIGEVDAPTIATYLHHLRCTIQRPVGVLWMWCTSNNPAEVNRARQLRIEWIRNIILSHFASTPAGYVQCSIV